MAENSKTTDITETGPLNYRQLQQENSIDEGLSPEFQDYLSNLDRQFSPVSLYDARAHVGQDIMSPLAQSNTAWGESMFDKKSVLSDYQFNALGDIRAENQPWYAKVGAGLTKGVVLAGTTFLDGTIGLITGAVKAANTGQWSQLWNNEVSQYLKSLNDASEEALPNYYTEREQNLPWYSWENISSANFIGDKFIKNLGFTVGAFYSGNVVSGGLKALLRAVPNVSRIVAGTVGVTLSALNEGRIEAINNSTQFADTETMKADSDLDNGIKEAQLEYARELAGEGATIDDVRRNYELIRAEYEATAGREAYNVNSGNPLYDKYQGKLAKLRQDYNARLGKIEEDRLKMGNADLLMNLPILTAGYATQFLKLYAGGANTALRVGGTLKNYTPNTSRFWATVGGVKGAITEGVEEMSQRVAQEIASDYYSTDINNFYKDRTNRTAEKEALSWWKSAMHGINATVNDNSAWEEFLIGALTGMLGMPSFRSMRTSDGKLQSPVYLRESIVGRIIDANKQRSEEQALANRLNALSNDPAFLQYLQQLAANHSNDFQSLTRHIANQIKMNKSIEAGDLFEYKNAELNQLINAVSAFDRAGRLDDLIGFISEAVNTSDDNLQAIVEYTTRKNEDGTTSGPFIDTNGNPMYSTPEGKEEMIKKLRENRDELINAIKDYSKIKRQLESRTGGTLQENQLEELVWMKSMLNNWGKRSTEMAKDVRRGIKSLNTYLDTQIRAMTAELQARRAERPIERTGEESEEIEKLEKAIENTRKYVDILTTLLKSDDKSLGIMLSSNPHLVKIASDIINDSEEILDADERAELTQKLTDLVRAGELTNLYKEKLNEYLNNPQKQAEDHAKADQEARERVKRETSDNFKESLRKAKTIKEFRDAADSFDSAEEREQALNELEKEGNPMVKTYREFSKYDKDVRRIINRLGSTDQEIGDALKLFQSHMDSAESLEDLTNKESAALTDEHFFDDDSNGDLDSSKERFDKASFILQRAIDAIKRNQDTRDRFSSKQEEANEEETNNGNEGATNKEATPTATSSNNTRTEQPAAAAKPSVESAVGDISKSEMADENASLNIGVDQQNSNVDKKSNRGEKKRYYRPAIPEVHIEASKNGDFRAFPEVANDADRGIDFTTIYDYLRDNGAFAYVNIGNLREGDELAFMIDPDFNDHTIFIIDKKTGQIVGSLDESDYSISRYEGLKELVEKIREEFAKRNKAGSLTSKQESLFREYADKGGFDIHYKNQYVKDGYFKVDDISIPLTQEEEAAQEKYASEHNGKWDWNIFRNAIKRYLNNNGRGKFIATPTTKVSKIMIGKIPYTNEERSLKDIPGVSEEGRKPIFAIVRNGVLVTGDAKIDPSLIISPMDMSNKEGRLYLLIPNGAGKYSPAAVRVKHFNREEFDLDDVTVANTPVGKSIREALINLARASSQEDVSEAVRALAQDLYMQDVIITWFNGRTGSGITISRKLRNPDGSYRKIIINGKEQIEEEKKNIYFTDTRHRKVREENGLEIIELEEVDREQGDSTNTSNPKKHRLYAKTSTDGRITSANENFKESKDLLVLELDDPNAEVADVVFDSTLFSPGYLQQIIDNRTVFLYPIANVKSIAVDPKKIITIKKGQAVKDENGKWKIVQKPELAIVNSDNDINNTNSEKESNNSTVTQTDKEGLEEAILEALFELNLPLQVSARRINSTGYNKRLINSDVLTSNLREASTVSTWFVTDYFDSEGNLQSAIPPPSRVPVSPSRKVETPIGGKESVIKGTPVVVDGHIYHVDLATDTILEEAEGKFRPAAISQREHRQMIIDLAWAEENFGSATNSAEMIDNKVITPSGKVLDRTNQKYLKGEGAQKVKDAINRKRGESVKDKVDRANGVIVEIEENQKKVAKDRTDQDHYYILEDDGEYHAYDRVHKRLGSNWRETEAQHKSLSSINRRLLELSDNPVEFNKYLRALENKYKQHKLDLSSYNNKTDSQSINAILGVIRDAQMSSNSKTTLAAGTSVDTVVRQFFTLNDTSKIERPSNISEAAFRDLTDALNEIKQKIQDSGETFLANNIVLFFKYPDGSRVAGEVDILAVDKEGNFKIYDIKTSRYSFGKFIDRNGKEVNYFDNASPSQRMSTREYYTQQLSAYKNLFESQYGVPLTTLGIMPFVLSYHRDQVASMKREKGILITYDPSVNVPLGKPIPKPAPRPVSEPQSSNNGVQEKPALPIFDAFMETLNPIEVESLDNGIPKELWGKRKMGYFEIDSKLYHGPLLPLGNYSGKEIYLARVPSLTNGLGNSDRYVSTWRYYVVYPNGKTVLSFRVSADPSGEEASKIIKTLKNSLESAKHTVAYSEEETLLTKGRPVPQQSSENSQRITVGERQYDVVRKTDKDGNESIRWIPIHPKKGVRLSGRRGLPINTILGERIMKVNDLDLYDEEELSEVSIVEYRGVNRNGDHVYTIGLRITDKTSGDANYDIFELLSPIKLHQDNGMPVESADYTGIEEDRAEDQNDTDNEVIGQERSASTNNSSNNAAEIITKLDRVDKKDPEYDDPGDADDLFGDKPRKADNTEVTVWNQEKELAWLDKALPQLSREGRVEVTKGLIRVGKKGAKAWGKFSKGIITLSDIAAEGTTYHEAFHAVFDLLLSPEERAALYEEAARIYGNKDKLALEEDMAEGFREYVMTQQNRGLGKRILDFFKNLFAKVTNWKYIQPSLTSYYRMIDQGRFKNREINQSIVSGNEVNSEVDSDKVVTTDKYFSGFTRKNLRVQWGTLTAEEAEALTKKGWTEERFSSVSQAERDHAVKCFAF